MNGFTEDLMNCVVQEISSNWERMNSNVEYFVNRVRKSGLTTADLADYLFERGKVGPVCVTTVFSAIVHDEPTDEKGGAQ